MNEITDMDANATRQVIITDPRRWIINMSVSAFIAMSGAAFFVMQSTKSWHFETFVSKAEAQQEKQTAEHDIQELIDQIAEIKALTEANRDNLGRHVHDFRTANALSLMDRSVERLEDYQKKSGIDPNNEATHDEYYNALERRVRQAQDYLACLNNQRNKDSDGCEMLRPRI